MIKVAILTISDSCAQGRREDVIGPAIRDMLPEDNSGCLATCCGHDAWRRTLITEVKKL